MGAGLVVAGLAAYGFLVISARALGPERYASLSALWALIFLIAPGVFVPVEQELTRALSARFAGGLGGAPVVRRAGASSFVLASAAVLACVVAAMPILNGLFDHQVFLLVGLIFGLVSYSAQHLVRGILAARSRFVPYGLILAGDGVLRLLGCGALALAAVDEAGPYGLVVGAAPLVAIGLGLRRRWAPLGPGPSAPWREYSTALGFLLASSVLAQLLANAGPILVKLLATDVDEAAAGRFLATLVIARIPLFLFQAVQAPLLPMLSRVVATRRHADFLFGLRRITTAVVVIGAFATTAGVAIGPWLVERLFGSEFALGRLDFGYLAGGSAAFMLAIAFAQALIALSGHARVSLGWLIGVGVFLIVTALGTDSLVRVEQGYLAGSLAAAAAMGALLIPSLPLAKWHSPDELVKAARHLPVEL